MMECKAIAGIRLPAVGIGTWGMGKAPGSGERPDYGNDEKCIAAIKGISRKKVFITTKVLPSHLEHDRLIAAANKSGLKINCGC